jgi:hypothetical protein
MAVVTKDAYTWLVIYPNGQELHEFDGPGTIGRGFAEVDSASVEKVALAREGRKPFVVTVPEGATPVFFRRRSTQLNLMTDNEEKRGTVHCIGWKREEQAGVYLFVFEDGSCLLSDNLQAV